MPHQCTNCGRTFPDGSKEMLSGCPDCGGNKFQFAPSSGTTAAGTASEPNAEAGGEQTGAAETPSGDESEPNPDGVASRAAETVRGWVSSGSSGGSTADPRVSSGSSGGSTADPTTTDPADTTTADAATTNATATETTDAESPSTTPENAEQRRPSEPASSSSETQSGTTSAAESDGFSEWPDSARRPEDRSSGTESGDDRSVTTQSSTEQTTAPRSVTNDQSAGVANDQPAGITEVETTVHPVESEDSAQASARSEVVPADDLPTDAGQDGGSGVVTDVGGSAETGAGSEDDQPPNDGRVVSEPSGEQPSIEDLRAELNEQFESIKIVRPGQYKLNLMELYNRDEYIISLQEDGRYVIDVPDSWHDGADE
ncbi:MULTISPECIES: OapC/ArvC family zinc-ribbon domain-containing protein [Natrialbaceae]|uniref:OapC/ArvC family zinc-ribbon domain-containing protein n=1 Tax=Natrialbaceae TaxID=1644061 RepID=UPI00207C1485|nr:Zn-ribbon containing protein [Natronococcus sp. CG52]